MRVTFLPNHIIQETPAGANLLDLISRAGIVIDGSCRGQGRCGCCRVQIVSGDAGMPDVAERKTLSAEDLAAGYRLACRVTVNDHLRVVLPNMTNADARKTRLVFMPEDFQPENGGPGLGAAFDIGTTTVVCMVWDLAEGRLVDIEAATNPQSVYGADVISRINYCGEATANLAQMQRLVTECFNGMLKQICRRSHLERQSIVQAVVVGNTTMSHLFLGANPATLAEAPFAPAFSGPQQRRAGDLGIEIAVDAPVLVLPNIAGHVGSDIVAGLMTSRLMDMPGCNVFIDMGTNGEVVLSDHGHSLACSTAAGPAFEGAAIFQGMRAASGAIEAVSIIDGVITLDVIDDVKPMGICGSGLIDAIACMLKSGLINSAGRLLDQETAAKKQVHPRLVDKLCKHQGMPAFILWEGETGEQVLITQKDIREVQLGKGAIFSGIKIMLQIVGKTLADVEKIYLAGAFGNYIKKESALVIGLMPNIGVDDIISIGNSAGAGASMALLSQEECQRIISKVQSIDHVELAEFAGFQDEFMRAMAFPK